MKVKEGQIYASHIEYRDDIELILIQKKHPDLDEFWFYQYQWTEEATPVSIITPKHLKNWEYIGEL